MGRVENIDAGFQFHTWAITGSGSAYIAATMRQRGLIEARRMTVTEYFVDPERQIF